MIEELDTSNRRLHAHCGRTGFGHEKLGYKMLLLSLVTCSTIRCIINTTANNSNLVHIFAVFWVSPAFYQISSSHLPGLVTYHTLLQVLSHFEVTP